MAVPASRAPVNLSVSGGYTVGGGFAFPQSNSTLTTASLPTDGATALITVDVVSYVLDGTGTTDVFFPNMPLRNNRINPLINNGQTQQKPLTVLPTDTLTFVGFQQGTNAPVNILPFAQQINLTHSPGPFIGPGIYTGFGVTIRGAAGNTGQVVGMLLLNRGK
jgi:hypothetical protein